MGVDTRGMIDKKHTPLDVQRALQQKFLISDSKFEETPWSDYTVLYFNYQGENRQLSIHTNYKEEDTKQFVTLMSFGAWGKSIELMRGIISCFGGYIQEYDTRDEWEFVNADDEIKLSEEEIRQNKLLTKIQESDLNFATKMKIVEYVNENLDFIKSL